MHMQVIFERKAGNLARARKSSRNAYVWAKRASVVGMIFYIVGFILIILGCLTGVGSLIYCLIVCIQSLGECEFDFTNAQSE